MKFSADDLDESNARQIEKAELYVVVEHYRDGGVWRHGSWPKREAERRAEQMHGFNRARTYVVKRASDV